MTTSPENPKKSLWGQEQWLPHTGLAAVGATAVAFFAVLAGWWGGLSRVLIRELAPQLLLDTVGVLLLVIFVLVFSLYRKIKAASAVKDTVHAVPVSTVAKVSNRAEDFRLHPLQERLLVIATSGSVSKSTLTDEPDVHAVESEFHYEELFRLKMLEFAPNYRRNIAQPGRAYLLKHGLMPPPESKKAPMNQPRRIPGSGMPIVPSSPKK